MTFDMPDLPHAAAATNTAAQTQLTQLFAQTFDIPEAKLTPDATLENLGLDSLAVIEFLFQTEDKFGIKIPDHGAPPRTFGEMVALIAALL